MQSGFYSVPKEHTIVHNMLHMLEFSIYTQFTFCTGLREGWDCIFVMQCLKQLMSTNVSSNVSSETSIFHLFLTDPNAVIDSEIFSDSMKHRNYRSLECS